MKRGRKSAASLGLVVSLPGQRPEPPSALTELQAEVWRATVATKPADWFAADTQPILAQYCRHAVSADCIARMLNEMETGQEAVSVDYIELLKARDRESRAMTALARSMRLTQQSRLKAETAATKAGSTGPRRPWEIGSA